MTRAPSGAERIEMWLGPAGAAYSVIKPIVEFLANPLDEVTGDPDQLRAKAVAWRDAAGRLEEFARSELDARTDLLSYWEGAAATSFNAEMAELNRSLTEIGEHFVATAELLEGSAEGAQQAQELVEQIVRELIAWLIVTIIVALASAWITAGASVAVGAAAGAVEAGLAGTRAAAVALRLANLLRKVAEFLGKMSTFAKAYKLTSIRSVGVQNWATARYASASGYQLIATNWVIKQAIVKPTLGPTIDKVTGADKSWELPQLL
ncbi:Proteins of 100 residues with WXG [Micromonospora pattaloongensis]|uniref:Proteins of 100 residues with WXG n=1 Tax=Micromonospora pattaloongensis TaxID=405436 RepID=A0A1H3SG47_9ACTN|nr:WXG100 family type VII secretion target [Micromonospora pattaloongensis]SDZ36565.1 Proteins of 100 residues with WXG [Micromonospora pattaloongensis]